MNDWNWVSECTDGVTVHVAAKFRNVSPEALESMARRISDELHYTEEAILDVLREAASENEPGSRLAGLSRPLRPEKASIRFWRSR
jgi:hypothetical protein